MAASKDPIAQVYDYVQKMLNEQHATYRPPASNRFRASEGWDCSRKIWYRLSGYGPDKPRAPFLEFITSDGNLLHDAVRYWMNNAGVEMYDLTFCNETGTVDEDNAKTVAISHNGEDFHIAFRADGGVVIDGVRHVLEIKTIDGFSYKWMEDAYTRGGWPRLMRYMKEHGKDKEDGKNNLGEKYEKFFAQATITGMLSDPPATHAYIVIKNRSLGQIGFGGSNEGLAVPLDPDLLSKILNKFAMITRCVREGTAPPQEYTSDSRACRQCDFAARCWGKDK